eukprot:1860811-Rhodomonas_salina.1
MKIFGIKLDSENAEDAVLKRLRSLGERHEDLPGKIKTTQNNIQKACATIDPGDITQGEKLQSFIANNIIDLLACQSLYLLDSLCTSCFSEKMTVAQIERDSDVLRENMYVEIISAHDNSQEIMNTISYYLGKNFEMGEAAAAEEKLAEIEELAQKQTKQMQEMGELAETDG